ncbi:MAG: hypothetical protein QM733_23935 [Ilumatobacteraceae bacterium]
MTAPLTVTGVLGGRWRADVTAAGDVVPWDGSAPLTWHVAADDRWHTPAAEAAVRQTRIEGTPVVETRLRIPSGDAVQRVWSIADAGGLTLVSVTNESPLPIAVAFGRGDLRTVRPPASVPIEGISLPAGSVVFPVGHHSTLTVGLAHRGGAGSLPATWPDAEQVVRGWVAAATRAGRFVVPDEGLETAIVVARCDLALAGPPASADDPAGFLLAVGQLVRMGSSEDADRWMPDVAHAAELVGRAHRRRGGDWSVGAALDAAVGVAIAAGDAAARQDLGALRSRLTIDRVLPDLPPAPGDPRWLAWQERRLVDGAPGVPGAPCRLLPLGLPPSWLGANVEAHGLPAGDGATASFALRWHGERPAVLWESDVDLVAPVVAPAWSSAGAERGEALWPAPPPIPVDSTSFQ